MIIGCHGASAILIHACVSPELRLCDQLQTRYSQFLLSVRVLEAAGGLTAVVSGGEEEQGAETSVSAQSRYPPTPPFLLFLTPRRHLQLILDK